MRAVLLLVSVVLIAAGAVGLIAAESKDAPIWFGAIAAGCALFVVDQVQARRARL